MVTSWFLLDVVIAINHQHANQTGMHPHPDHCACEQEKDANQHKNQSNIQLYINRICRGWQVCMLDEVDLILPGNPGNLCVTVHWSDIPVLELA